MSRARFRPALLALALAGTSACGESSGSVLERIPETPPGDPGTPPGSTLRVDYFLIHDVATCAVGDPCRNDPDMRNNGDCFELERSDGTRLGFQLNSVAFLAPEDPDITSYAQSQCFRLTLDDQAADDVASKFEELRNRVYAQSGTEILLDVRRHDVSDLGAGFTRYQNENGFFLPTRPLRALVPLASRDTDFVYAITGDHDETQGITPIIEHCGGTNRQLADGLAGAGYTWLTTECSTTNGLLRHWMFQVLVALRDADGFQDLYMHNFPTSCGQGASDPSLWWPSPDECAEDPDAPTCGDDRCEGTDDDYVTHVLHAHWPRGRKFVGNHCRNGRYDDMLDETDVDVGGVCDDLAP